MIPYLVIATFLFLGYFSKKPKKYYIISMIILFIFTVLEIFQLGIIIILRI